MPVDYSVVASHGDHRRYKTHRFGAAVIIEHECILVCED